MRILRFLGLSGVTRPDWIALGILTILWLVPVVLIGVHGEFPLNDDWAYTTTTKNLLDTGQFERHPWTFTSIYTNVGIGVVFSKLFGFSFETLRLSGVFMGWLGLIATYGLVRQLAGTPTIGFVSACLLGANPIYLNLSFTFMTDVPFTAFTTLALLFLSRALGRRSFVDAALGLVFSAAAMLSRQPGIALFVGLALTVVVATLFRRRRARVIVGSVVLLAVAYLLISNLLFTAEKPGGMFSVNSYIRRAVNQEGAFHRWSYNAVISTACLGLYLLPLTLVLLVGGRRLGRKLLIVSLAATAILTGVLVWKGYVLPLRVHTVYNFGVGPRSLWRGMTGVQIARGFWIALTAVGIFGGLLAGGLGLLALIRKRQGLLRRPEFLMVLSFPVIYMAVLLFRWPFFDRWFLPTLPALAAVLTRISGTPRVLDLRRAAPAIAVIVLTAVFSVVSLRDYLEHHRVTWQTIREIEETGVRPIEIEACFEHRGFYGKHLKKKELLPSDRFVLSHKPQIPGYVPTRSVRHTRWLPPIEEEIWVHERSAGGR